VLTEHDRDRFEADGFTVLPGFLPAAEIGAAMDGADVFPSARDFHQDVDHQRNEAYRAEFGGITEFPTTSTALNLLSVHPRLIGLAMDLLDDDDLRMYAIEAWAKYTGAADYDQPFHRDYLNHTILVPDDEAPPSQLEMFIYLSDVTDDDGPIALLPRPFGAGAPALPNWYPASDGYHDAEHPTWAAEVGRPDWYDHEVRAIGPAGTVVVYRIETFHRGTALRRPGGHRFTIHLNIRRAVNDWISRRAWTDRANDDAAWGDFVAAAEPMQLQLFGFPPPHHPYWTPRTLEGMALRYPGFDPVAWQ
jgi:hypothetical protein